MPVGHASRKRTRLPGAPSARTTQARTGCGSSVSTQGTTVLSGPIWGEPPRVRAQVVRRVCEALQDAYGRPRLGNPRAAIDDLVYVIISNKTAPAVARRVYREVKRRFPTWDDVLTSRAGRLRAMLAPAGLSTVKSQQIRAALATIAADFGRCSLRALVRRPEPEVERYLESLPGVSEKVAKCVMMYTMRAAVLPVDAHLHRIAVRLGWTRRKRADQCHAELEALVPPHRRYALHVDCVVHGRQVCRPTRPACEQCCVSRHCQYDGSVA